MRDNNYKIYFQLCLAQLFWAGTFVASQLALENNSPIFTALVKNILVALIFWGVVFFKKIKIVLPSKRCWFFLFLLGASGIFLYTLFVYYGLKKTTAADASLLIPISQPVFTVALSKLIYRESIKLNHIIGLILGFFGCLGILNQSVLFSNSANVITGNLLLLGGSFFFSVYSILGKAVLKELSPILALTYSGTIGALLFLPLIFFFNDVFCIQNSGMSFFLSMGYLVIFTGALPYLWWYNGVKILGTSKTGAITFCLPPFALILAFVILGQKVSPFQIVCALIGIIGGAYATGFMESLKPKANS